MAQKNSEYWQERFNALNESLLSKGEEYNKELILAYDEAIQNIQREIEIFYERFAANEMLSLSEAKKILNSQERKAFQMTLNQYIKYGKQNALDGKWVKELESASDIYRMDRLRALQLQMRQQVEILEAKKVTELSDVLGVIYEDGYYKTIYEIQKGLGEGMAFATLDTNKIEKVLSKPWAPDGSTFSQKIWGSDRTNLLYQLDTKFTQALIRGDNPNRIIKDMANTLNVSKSAASRLVMTESAYVASASRQDGYKALDVEEFEYVATLDLKTSDLCQSMDGQHFPMSEYQVGVNAPPLHPWCRSTTVPYFNDEFTAGQKRSARGEDGKTYKVPADMKYKDWHKEHVETSSEMLAQEKKLKNEYADRKQYEKYKEVLGKNAPKSFDKFQELKYNNSESWEGLKQDYKDQPIRDKLKSDEQIKTIHVGRQGKHIIGHNNYEEGRSYLTVSFNEAQELVNKYAGTGIIERDRKGAFNNKELIVSDKNIGVNVKESTKEETPTNKFYIHYSNKGTHIVPTLKEVNRND